MTGVTDLIKYSVKIHNTICMENAYLVMLVRKIKLSQNKENIQEPVLMGNNFS
jgi:hypothetical protein